MYNLQTCGDPCICKICFYFIDSRNWSTMFNDTIDYKTNKLMKRIEILNSTLLGLEKVRTIEKFALMSSRDYLTYVVKSNFTYRYSN